MDETPAIIGEIEAGRSARVRKDINKLITGVSVSTFDLADLLHEAKSKQYYSEWGFESFSKFAKSLEIKYTKCYYLVAISELMQMADIKRADYEPIGLAKLRSISRLQKVISGEYNNIPMVMVVRDLAQRAKDMTPEDVTLEVEKILGLTEDESMVWLNIKIKKSARDNVIIPALNLAKKHMPQTQDEEGNYVDSSDGAALEMMSANFLSDPNFNNEESTNEKTGVEG